FRCRQQGCVDLGGSGLADAMMALLMFAQCVQIPFEALALLRVGATEAGQGDDGVQAGACAFDPAATVALFAPPEIPLHLPAGVGVIDLAVLADRRSLAEGSAEGFAGGHLQVVALLLQVLLNFGLSRLGQPKQQQRCVRPCHGACRLSRPRLISPSSRSRVSRSAGATARCRRAPLASYSSFSIRLSKPFRRALNKGSSANCR